MLLADQDRVALERRPDRPRARGARPGPRAARAAGRTSSRRRSRRCTWTSRIDWPQIAALYGELVRLTGSPVVELNRAIAVAEAEGTDAGLALVDRLDLDGYQYFHSTRADLLRRLGRADEARTEYERALELATPSPSAAS